MAQGDFTVFQSFLDYMNIGAATSDLASVNVNADSFKIGLINNTAAPANTTATADWGDFSANEVSGNGYTAGGAAATISASQSAGTLTFSLDANVVWTSTGTGDATGIYWGILYSTTHTGTTDAIGFFEVGTNLDLNNGDITINSGNILTIGVA